MYGWYIVGDFILISTTREEKYLTKPSTALPEKYPTVMRTERISAAGSIHRHEDGYKKGSLDLPSSVKRILPKCHQQKTSYDFYESSTKYWTFSLLQNWQDWKKKLFPPYLQWCWVRPKNAEDKSGQNFRCLVSNIRQQFGQSSKLVTSKQMIISIISI